MEIVNCDFCGSDDTTLIAKQSDKLHNTTEEFFNIVKCGNCGLNYTNPRPDIYEIGNYYSDSYAFHSVPSKFHQLFSTFVTKVVNSPFSIFVGILPILASRLIPFIKPDIPDPVLEYYEGGGEGDFLDIGCGSGNTAHFWGRKGAILEYQKKVKVSGIEVSGIAREKLNDTGIEHWDSLNTVPDDRRFGMIRMNWSLEHVHSPSQYFSFMHKHLLQNGRVMISVPNYDGLIYKMAPDCVELPIHLYHFRTADIQNYALSNGFKVKSIRTFSYPQMFISASESGLLPDNFKNNIKFKHAKAFQCMTKVFDNAGYGNDMIVVLQRDT